MNMQCSLIPANMVTPMRSHHSRTAPRTIKAAMDGAKVKGSDLVQPFFIWQTYDLSPLVQVGIGKPSHSTSSDRQGESVTFYVFAERSEHHQLLVVLLQHGSAGLGIS